MVGDDYKRRKNNYLNIFSDVITKTLVNCNIYNFIKFLVYAIKIFLKCSCTTSRQAAPCFAVVYQIFLKWACFYVFMKEDWCSSRTPNVVSRISFLYDARKTKRIWERGWACTALQSTLRDYAGQKSCSTLMFI